MQMPTLLPSHLAFLTQARNDNELLSLLSSNIESAVSFFELLSGDTTWLEAHEEFVKIFLKWLTNQSLGGGLDEDLMERVQESVYRHPRHFKPLMHYDLKVKAADRMYPVNSLMLSSSSRFFNDRIRSQQEKVIKVNVSDAVTIEKVFDAVHGGSKELWRYSQEELEALLMLAQKWELREICDTCEKLLCHFLNPENVFNMLVKGYQFHWMELAKASCSYLNELDQGLRVFIKEADELKVQFLDLKGLTIRSFDEISSLAHILQFTGSLTLDPLFVEMIHKTPYLKGLDISATSDPPSFFQSVPPTLDLLDLSRCFWLNDDLFAAYLKQFRQLTRLYLVENTSLTFRSWSQLPLHGLKVLDLSRCKQISSEDLPVILQSTGDLLSLSLDECQKISSHAIQTLFRHSSHLTHLSLVKTQIDDSGLSEIGSRLKNLIKIDLSRSTLISDLGLGRLLRNVPTLEELYLAKTRIGSEKIQELEKRYPDVKFHY